MNRSEIYRKRAQDCLKLADKFTLIELQGCLLSMAYAWWRLAEVAPVLLESAGDGKLKRLPLIWKHTPHVLSSSRILEH